MAALVFRTEPTAERVATTREAAMPVTVEEVDVGNYRPRFEAMGTVRPSREIVLSPRVEGEVVDRASEFVPGGVVTAGERLLRLDPADYEHALEQRRGELEQAKSDLQIQRGEQQVAEGEYEMLDEQLSPDQRALVLREPQLASARAQVQSAQAAVEQAELELERTAIRAPFDAQVLSREVNLGSQVGSGQELARLAGAEMYWIEVTVPVAKLPWIRVPDGGREEGGADVVIRDRGAWPEDASRSGEVDRLIGTLSEDTRMARLLVAVADPLGREGPEERPRLLIDAYVECRIQGRLLEEVVRLDRDAVRSGDTAWVMAEGELEIRELEIRVRDEEYAYVTAGLQDGDQVVTSELTTVQEGAPLRQKESGS
ncbi:MAG: efflux RND transporter periplasmic adaptor subunit [Halorhodospira sp.]